MTTKTITEPLSDGQLAAARDLVGGDLPEGPGALQAAVEIAEDLLAEVDRLRALLASVRTHQVGMARGFRHDAEAQHQRAGRVEWSVGHTAARAEGAAWGAVAVLQMLLMDLGEVEYDEAAETTWDLVQAEMEAAKQQ